MFRITWTDDKGHHDHLERGHTLLEVFDRYRKEMNSHHLVELRILEESTTHEEGGEG